jgi:hypothetical protein
MLAMHEPGSDRHLESNAGQSLLRRCFVNTLNLEKHGPGLFERFGGDRFMRENPDKDPTFTPHKVTGRHTTGFDLLGGDPGMSQGLQSKLTERDRVATAGNSAILTALTFAELNPLGHHWHKALNSC